MWDVHIYNVIKDACTSKKVHHLQKPSWLSVLHTFSFKIKINKKKFPIFKHSLITFPWKKTSKPSLAIESSLTMPLKTCAMIIDMIWQRLLFSCNLCVNSYKVIKVISMFLLYLWDDFSVRRPNASFIGFVTNLTINSTTT